MAWLDPLIAAPYRFSPDAPPRSGTSREHIRHIRDVRELVNTKKHLTYLLEDKEL
jgi:hypothetical protein